MTLNREKHRKQTPVNILIPVGDVVSKQLITQALHVLSAFKRPLIVLFNVIEVPSRTATLETDPYRKQISETENRLNGLQNG